jgi:hypothetical protein
MMVKASVQQRIPFDAWKRNVQKRTAFGLPPPCGNRGLQQEVFSDLE